MAAYSDNGFVIFPFKTGYIVYNQRKEFHEGHSHLKSFKACRDAIIFVSSKKIPKKVSNYYLTTLQRLATDIQYITQIEELKDVRKKKGKKPRCYK